MYAFFYYLNKLFFNCIAVDTVGSWCNMANKVQTLTCLSIGWSFKSSLSDVFGKIVHYNYE